MVLSVLQSVNASRDILALTATSCVKTELCPGLHLTDCALVMRVTAEIVVKLNVLIMDSAKMGSASVIKIKVTLTLVTFAALIHVREKMKHVAVMERVRSFQCNVSVTLAGKMMTAELLDVYLTVQVMVTVCQEKQEVYASVTTKALVTHARKYA